MGFSREIVGRFTKNHPFLENEGIMKLDVINNLAGGFKPWGNDPI